MIGEFLLNVGVWLLTHGFMFLVAFALLIAIFTTRDKGKEFQ